MADNKALDLLAGTQSSVDENVLNVQAPLVAPEDVASAAPAAPAGEKRSFLSLWAEADSIPNALARGAASVQMDVDENWDIAKFDQKEFAQLTEGFDEDTLTNIGWASKSEAHMRWLIDVARSQEQAEQQLAEYGGWGVAGRVGMSFVDPGSLLIGVSTGGIGHASKLYQMKNALGAVNSLRSATAAVTAARSMGAFSTLAEVGIAGGLEEAFVQSIADQSLVTRDGTDVAWAGLTGMTGSMALYGLFNAREMRAINAMGQEAKQKLALYQLRDKAETELSQIVGKLAGDPDAARASQADLEFRVGTFAASHNGPTDTYVDFRRALESFGGKADAKSSTSTATGADQFLEKTWLDVVEQADPQWARGVDNAALLEMRKDPAKSAEMAKFLDDQNASILRASKLPVNNFTLYAMHHFGPSRGKKFAAAAEDALMDDLFPEGVLKANPYLRGKTKGQVLANWTARADEYGVDVGAIVKSTGLPEGFDRVASEGRLRQLEAQEGELRALDFEAETAMKPSDRRRLERDIARAEEALRGHRGSDLGKLQLSADDLQRRIDEALSTRPKRLADLEARDLASMGEGAKAKGYRKLREKSVDRVLDVETRPLRQELADLKETVEVTRKRTETGLAGLRTALEADVRAVDARTKARDIRTKGAAEAKSLREALGMDIKRNEMAEGLKGSKERRADINRADRLKGLLDGTVTAIETNEMPSFGEDTLSAARSLGFEKELFPGATGATGKVDRMNFAGVTNLWNRGTFSGVLRGNSNATVRDNYGRLVGNVLGQKNAAGEATAVELGASEIQTMLARKYSGQFHSAVNESYPKWLEEKGISKWKSYNRDIRETFMSEVGLQVRGVDSGSPATRSMAARVSKLYADMLADAKEAGVAGFENVAANAGYLPRVFDWNRFGELHKKFGTDQLETLVAKGMLDQNPELGEDLAKRLGQFYIKRLRELRVGNDVGVLAGMTFDDIAYLRSFLKEAEVGADEIEAVVGKFAAAKTQTTGNAGEGSIRSAKRRAKFDDAFTMKLRNNTTYEYEDVRISDFLENNVEALTGRYIRSVGGHTALAKVGIKSHADWTNRKQTVANELENEADLETIQNKAQMAYDLVAGNPIDKANGWTEMFRFTRDLTYATQMENAGIANLPDLASLLSYGNFRLTMKQLPQLRAMFSRNGDARLRDAFYRELEEQMGVGTDWLNNSIFSSYDVTDTTTVDLAGKAGQVYSKAAHGARVVGRGVTAGSGMAALNSLGKRMAAYNAVYRLKNDVFKKGGLAPARKLALGIDDAMSDRIAAQLRKHTTWQKNDVGGDIETVNWSKWDDIEARDTLMGAVMREANKNIQEDDIGDTFGWQQSALGKLFTQFRRFVYTANTRQFMRMLNERDAETVTRVALQSILAGTAYMARHQLVIAGMELAGVSDEEVTAYEKKNLDPRLIGGAMVRNAGWAAFWPDVYDTTIGSVTGVPLFDVRNSGNSSTLASFPGLSLGQNIGKAATGTAQAILRGDRQFDRNDLKAVQALVPFGNHLLVAPLFQSLATTLPERDEDTDPDEVDWF